MTNDFPYDYLDHVTKVEIVEAQARQLEIEHFSLCLIEPSKLGDTDQHGVWRSQKLSLETAIMRVRDILQKIREEE